ncbi:MAG: MATE family efflux transporter [Termitinemataceae bacterium]|nr:MAG: MATE family efflux transporter [Termitinemataceae bacterium]
MIPCSKKLFSNNDLVHLIWPLLAEQLLLASLGLADIVMVASLGENAVSGVSLVDSINILITGVLGAMATGGAVVCSHYFGSRNAKMVSVTACQLIYTMCALASIFMIVAFMFKRQILCAIFGAVDPVVMENANTYFFWTLPAMPLIALYSSCAALFRAQGNSTISLFTSLIINAINIGGNALCIYGLKMGVEGVAIPTLVSRGAAGALLLCLLYKARPYRGRPAIRINGILKIKIDFLVIKNILRIGLPEGIDNTIFQLGKILLLTLMATYGTEAIAANATANTIATFGELPGNAMSLAIITVVGQCLGAGKIDQAIYYTRKLMIITCVIMAFINLIIFIFLTPLVSIFNLNPGTVVLASEFIKVHCFAAGILFWSLSFSLPYALRAANDAKFTMAVSLTTMWTVRIGISYFFAHFTKIGAIGIWYAMFIDWTLRSIIFVLRWKKGAWKRHCSFLGEGQHL